MALSASPRPLVSGVTVLKDGVRLDYCFREAIRSALPLCDEYLVVLGRSEDGTREAIEEIDDPRIRIVDTEWSSLVQPRQALLAQQTNLGLHLARGYWVLNMQAAEALHEDSVPRLRNLLEEARARPEVEAVLMQRRTFYADAWHRVWVYPEAFKFVARIVRPHIGIHAIRDAMSVAVFDRWSTRGRRPRVLDSGEDLFRYAFVHTPAGLAARSAAVHLGEMPSSLDEDRFFTWLPRQWIKGYSGPHPTVMAGRLQQIGRQYDLDDPRCRTRLSRKEWFRVAESLIYQRLGFPPYRDRKFELLGGLHPSRRAWTSS